MRVLLDTSALNWLVDNPPAAEEFLERRDAGVLEVLVTPEAAAEIRRTQDPNRRAALEEMLKRFFPLTPTRVPRVGSMRLDLFRLPTNTDTERLRAIEFLRDGQDRNLAANAAGYQADVFLTCDKEMLERKRGQLEEQLGGTRILAPPEFLRALRTEAGSEVM